MTTEMERDDLSHEATRLGGRYSGLVDALVMFSNYREALPRGEVREALRTFHDLLGEKANEVLAELDATVERLNAANRAVVERDRPRS